MARSLAALFLVLTLSSCDDDEALPEMFVVRDFSLTAHTGEPFDSSALEGHVWVTSFVFTKCRGVCPLIINEVAKLHRRVDDPRVRFVSISVDPEVDTPEVLAEHRARYDADDRWLFLTGDPDDVRDVIGEHFHMEMGERSGGERAYDISHTETLLLVDQSGVVRGQYATDAEGMDALADGIARLLAAD